MLRYLCVIGLALVAIEAADAQQFDHATASHFPPAFNEYTNQLAIEDIDNDGDLDIAFANGSGFFSASQMQRLRIYINNGVGVFTEESSTRVGSHTSYARDVEFGDIDGDGDWDMIVANDFNSPADLFVNDGNGFFTDVSAAQIPQLNLSSSHAAFGDVDNDGDLDLWLTKGGSSRFGAGQAQLWQNDGSGFYTNVTSSQLPQQLVDSPMDAIFGDLDGDFDLDMVEGHRDVQSKLYINAGDGNFTDETSGNFPSDNNTYSWDLGDLDNDGDLDLLGVNSNPSNAREVLWINDGNADFTNMTTTFLPTSSNPSIDDNDSKFFDADNDGDLDFVIGSLGSTERICIFNGTQFIWNSGLIDAIGDSTMDVEMGDIDGDGALDMITGQGESGSFTNRVYIDTGPADTIAPNFPDMEQLADTLDAIGPYVVRVKIRDGMTSDHNFFMQERVMVVTVDGATPTEIPLIWSGGDVYRAEIPGQPSGGTVEYAARSTDWAGNTGTSMTLSFEVITEFFDRGDCNGDGDFNLADAVALLSGLFDGMGFVPDCEDACDSNDDGALDVADPVAMLATLFAGAGPLPDPHTVCGVDPTDGNALDCPTSPCP